MPDTNLVCYCNNVNQNQVKSEYVKRLTYPYQSCLWKKFWGKLPIWYGNQVWGSLFRVLIWQFQLFFSEVYFCFLILQINVIRCWLWGLVWQDLSAEFLVQWLLLIVGFTAFPPALCTAPWVVVSIETGLLGLELSWGNSQVWTWSIFLGSSIFFSSMSYMIGNIFDTVKLNYHIPTEGTRTDKWVIIIAAIPYCWMVFILPSLYPASASFTASFWDKQCFAFN